MAFQPPFTLLKIFSLRRAADHDDDDGMSGKAFPPGTSSQSL